MLQNEFDQVVPDRQAISDLAKHFVMDLFAFKHPKFSSEREIRISRLLLKDASSMFGVIDGGGHTGDGSLVAALPVQRRTTARYGEALYVTLPIVGGIKSIGLGPRTSQADRDEFAALQRAGDPRFKLWQSRIPYR
jgi:hypothetical protein